MLSRIRLIVLVTALPLHFALHLLDINMRDEAGQHEPLE